MGSCSCFRYCKTLKDSFYEAAPRNGSRPVFAVKIEDDDMLEAARFDYEKHIDDLNFVAT
jgi:hypothetical protein